MKNKFVAPFLSYLLLVSSLLLSGCPNGPYDPNNPNGPNNPNEFFTITLDADDGYMLMPYTSEDGEIMVSSVHKYSFEGQYGWGTDLNYLYNAGYLHPEKDGYVFLRWSESLPETFTENKTIYALYEKINVPDPEPPAGYKIPYMVFDHYEIPGMPNKYDSYPRPGTFEGAPGDETAVECLDPSQRPPEYQNHVALPINQQIIRNSGQTIVRVYYDCRTVTYTFMSDEKVHCTVSGKVKEILPVPEIPVKEHYIFDHWESDNGDRLNTHKDQYGNEQFQIPADENRVYKAVWTEAQGPSIEVNIIAFEDLNIEVSQNGTVYTLTSSWADDPRPGQTTQMVIDVADFKPGTYWYDMTAYKNNIGYSARVEIVVKKVEE